ncbi:hypothetical protein C8J27_103412 [Rhodobacter aestuarii]|uniref:Uncharacterized protein n=1 Tax=Rhodobacter aestuarii TaxID=453582 RepID=A0A1N7JM50_9RHOB|nr:DUF6404 family protein [Rhodobacter aestuarii]PTV96079.1 hypothetical protein C8J27_103412 [Rhodobacter aestuarii]SIS50334.1 hypothetical protein SAMN05421580_10223 [Rhodobacter aestuarii]
MSEYERRLAAAKAELDSVGLKAPRMIPGMPFLLRMLGESPRPWPYLPLHLRLLAYGIPFALINFVVNVLWHWTSFRQDPTIILAMSLIAIPLFTLLMGFLERMRWCRKGLSRWEEL